LGGEREYPVSSVHDVSAYLHVRKNRKNWQETFQKTKFWFISSNTRLCKYNHTKVNEKRLGSVPEIVTPDIILSLLWLKNPNSLSQIVGKIGISELIAEALDEDVPTYELARRIDENVKKFVNPSKEDYALLATNLASHTSKELTNLIKLVENGQEIQFREDVIQKIKEAKEKNIEILDDLFNAKNQNKTLVELSKEREAENEQLRKKVSDLETEKRKKIVNDKIKKWKFFSLIVLFVVLIIFMCVWLLYGWSYDFSFENYENKEYIPKFNKTILFLLLSVSCLAFSFPYSLINNRYFDSTKEIAERKRIEESL
jgi:hypothetical protein